MYRHSHSACTSINSRSLAYAATKCETVHNFSTSTLCGIHAVIQCNLWTWDFPLSEKKTQRNWVEHCHLNDESPLLSLSRPLSLLLLAGDDANKFQMRYDYISNVVISTILSVWWMCARVRHHFYSVCNSSITDNVLHLSQWHRVHKCCHTVVLSLFLCLFCLF